MCTLESIVDQGYASCTCVKDTEGETVRRNEKSLPGIDLLEAQKDIDHAQGCLNPQRHPQSSACSVVVGVNFPQCSHWNLRPHSSFS